MTSLPLPQWLCFDLDGTLVDSAPDLTVSLNHMLQKMNLAPASEGQVRSWIGDGAVTLIQRALAHAQCASPGEEVLEQAKELFFKAYKVNVVSRTTVYPDSHKVLEKLREEDIRLGCVTNKPRQFVEPLLQKLSLKPYFTSLVCGDDLPVKKPSPDPLLHAVHQLDSKPDLGYMVGDSETDMIAAQAAGTGAIYATYGYNRRVCEDQEETARIDHLKELLQLFNIKSTLDVSTS